MDAGSGLVTSTP
ncbi:hypothetical protein SAMN02787118_105399 [Streptomyces mirabilis]|uniref:Uncharacterized protein n=2 Tax=Streptomyces mirabilis TaxID=68239 RepID=A0A1I2HWS8_9ACTN|nr:hypothetical protein SAMN02787118_105399 [Streptomyces mirabilis]